MMGETGQSNKFIRSINLPVRLLFDLVLIIEIKLMGILRSIWQLPGM